MQIAFLATETITPYNWMRLALSNKSSHPLLDDMMRVAAANRCRSDVDEYTVQWAAFDGCFRRWSRRLLLLVLLVMMTLWCKAATYRQRRKSHGGLSDGGGGVTCIGTYMYLHKHNNK